MYTVKQARLLSGLTQCEVAKRMNIDVGTYRKMEMFPENTTIKRAKIFSDTVKIPIDLIFFDSDSTLSRTKKKSN